MADAEQPLQTYRGNCHCGAFVYEIDVPEIKSVTDCNCSICFKKGSLWIFLERKSFRVVKGDIAQLTAYSFGCKRQEHQFCPNCGTALMRSALTDEIPRRMELAINVHAIQGINTGDLEVKPFNGRKLLDESTYEPPTHRGELPRAEIEGAKIYMGSCHCGKVTVAVKSKPIDETFDESPVVVCNCSICERGGYIWIYPSNDQVVLAGDEADIGWYFFGRRFVGKTFCRTCGVHLTNRFDPEVLKGLPQASSQGQKQQQPEPANDEKTKWQYRASKKHPVNIRVLEGVDLSRLTFRRIDTASQSPLYVDP